VFSRREKVLLALAAIAVAVAVGVQLLGDAVGSAGADPSSELARWKALRQRVDDAQARLDRITTPESEVTARMLRAAQANGSAAGVTITSARPRRATKTGAGCGENALEIQAAGRFPDIAKFMFELEAENGNLRIARVAINSSEGGSDKVNCTIIIVGYSPGEVEQ